jgi:Protein of unknown function (DUF763)
MPLGLWYFHCVRMLGDFRLMAQRSGTANLPLHGGQVPKWLVDRMTRLGAVMSEAIVHHYGRDELLRRLAHPFWFQSFGAVMGMDWHSSGITTSGRSRRMRLPQRCIDKFKPMLRFSCRAIAGLAGAYMFSHNRALITR